MQDGAVRRGRTWRRRGEGLCHGGLPTLSKGNWSDPWEVTHPTYNPHVILCTHFAFALGVSVQEGLRLGPGCPELGGACLPWSPQEAFQIPQNIMNYIFPSGKMGQKMPWEISTGLYVCFRDGRVRGKLRQ